jgi:hypothetical protein
VTEQGTYWGTLKGGYTGTAKSGNPQVVLNFVVTNMAVGSEWQPIRDPFEKCVYLSLTDAAWPYSQVKLASLGFNGDFGEGMGFSESGAKLICKHENYNGQMRDKWDLDGGGEGQRADTNTVRKLNALWRAKANTPKPPNGRPQAPPARPEPDPAPTADDEMPPRVDANGIPF